MWMRGWWEGESTMMFRTKTRTRTQSESSIMKKIADVDVLKEESVGGEGKGERGKNADGDLVEG